MTRNGIGRKFIARNLEETQKIAGDFVEELFDLSGQNNDATVVGLYGELGAGKTSFTQGVAKALGIEVIITSPTFVLMKKYEIQNVGGEMRDTRCETREDASPSYLISRDSRFGHLIHIDAYRIEKSEELLHLGWKEIISDPSNLVLIEWPERVADIMPTHIKVNFSHISEDGRKIEIDVY